jgi:GNAT superfamily N-acetyltransferase
MRYREANLDDAASIAAIHTESWRSTYRDALSTEFLSGPIVEDRADVWRRCTSAPSPNQYVVVAEEGADMVGFACAYGGADERWGTLVDNIHIVRKWQGSGVGRRLLARVAEWCVSAYPDGGLYLSVLEGNTRAQQFYQHLGAIDVGAGTWTPPGGGSAPTLMYAWTTAQLVQIRLGDG